ncbi:MAG: BatD family protein [Granulosicoccus sp.]
MPQNLGNTQTMNVVWTFLQAILISWTLLLTLLASSLSYAQEGTVNSRLSASTITRDESVTLEIVAIGLDKELDLSSLEKDFDVAGRSSSREVNSILSASGELRTTSIVTWTVQLLPKDVGVFTVPSVRVGDVSSQSHTLTVNDLPKGAQRDIFIEASVDTTTPWVQSQVLMTLKVFQAIEIVDGGLDVPEADDLVVERLGEDVRSTETRDGRQYSVTTRRFALFPQKSGEITLKPITLSVSVPADPNRVRTFFSPTRKLTRRSDSITLNVKPRPESGTAWWLPAKAVQLNSQWIGDINNATVDQPLTRTITIRASGVADSQLPDINIPAVEGASLYAEQPVRQLGANQQGLVSELTLKWALIPQRVGQVSLPPVVVEWFNTSTGQVEKATLAAETISVTSSAAANSVQRPAAEITNSAVTPQQTIRSAPGSVVQDTSADETAVATGGEVGLESRVIALQDEVSFWRSLLIGVLVLWLGSAMLFWWAKARSNRGEGTEPLRRKLGAVKNAASQSLSNMQPLGGVAASCKSGELETIRSAIIEWSSRQWPDNTPLSLTDVAGRLPVGAARTLIADLDAALYSQRGRDEDSTALRDRLQELPELLKNAVTSNQADQPRSGVSSGKELPAL